MSDASAGVLLWRLPGRLTIDAALDRDVQVSGSEGQQLQNAALSDVLRSSDGRNALHFGDAVDRAVGRELELGHRVR